MIAQWVITLKHNHFNEGQVRKCASMIIKWWSNAFSEIIIIYILCASYKQNQCKYLIANSEKYLYTKSYSREVSKDESCNQNGFILRSNQ